jgi:hypothetical protein
MIPPDHIFQSIQSAIKEKVAEWVEEAIAAGCPFVKGNGSGNSGAILFSSAHERDIFGLHSWDMASSRLSALSATVL